LPSNLGEFLLLLFYLLVLSSTGAGLCWSARAARGQFSASLLLATVLCTFAQLVTLSLLGSALPNLARNMTATEARKLQTLLSPLPTDRPVFAFETTALSGNNRSSNHSRSLTHSSHTGANATATAAAAAADATANAANAGARSNGGVVRRFWRRVQRWWTGTRCHARSRTRARAARLHPYLYPSLAANVSTVMGLPPALVLRPPPGQRTRALVTLLSAFCGCARLAPAISNNSNSSANRSAHNQPSPSNAATEGAGGGGAGRGAFGAHALVAATRREGKDWFHCGVTDTARAGAMAANERARYVSSNA